MPKIFWLGLGFAAVVFLISTFAGARSRTGTVATGAAIGAFMGFMLAFPLLAIGIASS
jgi:hypothetical protein